MSNLHLINDNGKLENAALLRFGKAPNKYLTSFYFKIGRFSESDADLPNSPVVRLTLTAYASQRVGGFLKYSRNMPKTK